MSPIDGFFATRPANLVALRTGSLAEVETTAVAAVGHRYHALRERLRPEELAAMMIPASPWLARFSLYQLPVSTQSALRVLLLMPLGALVIALFRNGFGISTFGTFMPVLIALALRQVALAAGLMLVAAVLLLGILGRLVLERMHLLLVPRLGVLLCAVVLSVTSFALLGREAEVRELSVGVLFPMVILTMLIERFSVTLAEEGLRPALVRAGWSVVVAVAVYPIFHSAGGRAPDVRISRARDRGDGPADLDRRLHRLPVLGSDPLPRLREARRRGAAREAAARAATRRRAGHQPAQPRVHAALEPAAPVSDRRRQAGHQAAVSGGRASRSPA